MPGFVEEDIERYALEHTTAQTPGMAELQRDALASLSAPQMLSGPVEGRLLELLVWGMQARKVLEIGTFAGYSALSIASGLHPEGRIVTCEISESHAEFARAHIAASPYAERVELRVGPALETINELNDSFDLVFIDADKAGYADYYEAVLPKLSSNGLIVVDNTLWSGRVLDLVDASADTRALAAFNDKLVNDERVNCVMLTVRDGITLIRRR